MTTAITILIALLQSAGVSGNVPAGVDAVEATARVMWIPAGASAGDRPTDCAVEAGSRWLCATVPAGERGVAVVFGGEQIGYVVIGPAGTTSGRAGWGRLVRVTPAGLAAEALTGVRVS